MNSPIMFEQSLWLLVLVVGGAAAFSLLLYYRTKSAYPGWLKVLLFFVRFVVITLIGLLLLKPYMRQQTTIKEPPVIAVLHDNSASISMVRDSAYSRLDYLQQYDSLLMHLSENYQTDSYLFGSSLQKGRLPDYSDATTDFSSMLSAISQRYYKRNLAAVVLLSDGIYNAGFQPELAISEFPFVVHSVLLGDTNIYPDASIYDVRYNRKALLEAVFPVEVTIRAQQANGKIMQVNLFQDDELLETRSVNIRSNRFSSTLNFLIEADSPGLKNLKIQIEPLENESYTVNNEQVFFVEVIEQKRQIIVMAHAPHPDLAAIKSALGDGYSFDFYFGETIPDSDTEIPDLLILHQLPDGLRSAQNLKEYLNKYPKMPILLINGQKTAVDKFNELQAVLAIDQGMSTTSIDATPLLNKNFSAFTTADFEREAIQSWPPLNVIFGDYRTAGNAEILFSQKLRGVETSRPLIMFGKQEQRKIGIVSGTGIWRWRLFQFKETGSHQSFDALMGKLIQYAALQQDNSRLKIRAEEEYTAGSPVMIYGEIRNKSGELIVEPQLKIRLVNEQKKLNYDYEFTNFDKTYQLNAGRLEEGIYTYEAEALLAGESLRETGRFSVKKSALEGRHLVADAQRMKQIAATTGGKYYQTSDFGQLLADLQADERLVTVSHQEKRFEPLINLQIILLALLMLLSIEWLLRKIFGAY